MAGEPCTENDCSEPIYARGLCQPHYRVFYRSDAFFLIRVPKPGHCAVQGCPHPVKSRGWCEKHYTRWRVRGDPEWTRPTDADRFWAKVDKTDNCWLWTATVNANGYGQAWFESRLQLAHRVAYQLVVGPIPDGLSLDHLCRTPGCVNPAHLEPVTHRENCLRGVSPAARQAQQTHCKRGHEFDDENTYVDPSGGRRCRQCRRDTRAERRQLGLKVW